MGLGVSLECGAGVGLQVSLECGAGWAWGCLECRKAGELGRSVTGVWGRLQASRACRWLHGGVSVAPWAPEALDCTM